MEPHVYQRKVDLSAGNDSLALIARHIPRGARVLELGTATGYFSRALTEELGCEVDGVELDPEMAREARPWCRKLVVGSLESIVLKQCFPRAAYDAIVCADVLEHLVDPSRVIKQLPALLSSRGVVLVSVPNAAYGGIIAELMLGDFQYRPEGLLDRSHLRFFTRKSVVRLFETCGFRVESVQTTCRYFEHSEFCDAISGQPEAIRQHLASLQDADSYQFILRVVPNVRGTATFVPVDEDAVLEPVNQCAGAASRTKVRLPRFFRSLADSISSALRNVYSAMRRRG